MGGTTAKVGLVRDGTPQITKQYHVGAVAQPGAGAARGSGYPIRTPVIELAEIGAGGGSIAWVDSGGSLRVGPISAGAEPGPAAYGRGGTEPTVTDANLVLGRLSADLVPRRRAASRRGRGDARDRASAAPARSASTSTTAAFGIVEIANAAMASALRLMSVQRGLDPRAFGARRVRRRGPGPRQPAGVGDGHRQDDRPAEPRHVLGARAAAQRPSARLLADVPAPDGDRRRRTPSGRCSTGSRPRAGRCSGAKASPTPTSGSSATPRCSTSARATCCRSVCRRRSIDPATWPPPRRDFHEAHERAYGFAAPAEPTEIVNLRLAAIGAHPAVGPAHDPGRRAAASSPKETRDVYFAETGGFTATPIYDRAHFGQATRLTGPCIVEEMDSTTVIHPGYVADLDAWGNLVIGPSGWGAAAMRLAAMGILHETNTFSTSPTDDDAFAHSTISGAHGDLLGEQVWDVYGHTGITVAGYRDADALPGLDVVPIGFASTHPGGTWPARDVRARSPAAQLARLDGRGPVRRRADGPARRDGRRGLSRRRRRVHPARPRASSGRASRSAT